MTVWTVHLRAGRPAVLVPERFSFWAMLFGPLWLLAHGAWIPAVLVFCAFVVAAVAVPGSLGLVVLVGMAWLVGLSAQDMRRWSLGLRGYALVHVVAGTDADVAVARLHDARPDLAEDELRAVAGGTA